MIIIGEKINGTIKKVREAIERRDEAFIRNLALAQAEAGADYIDVCAGTAPEKEVETLTWLIELVQEVTDKPLSIDSPNPRSIEAVVGLAKQPGIINSVSAEGDKCDIIYPLIQGTGWQVIALTCDDKGIPQDVATRVSIAELLVNKAAKYGIEPDRIYIDPLVLALAADNQSFNNFIITLKKVKELFPSIKITSGLSNISFGMPLRRLVNRTFLTMTLFAGMDSAILDPLDRDLMGVILAAEALLGRDRHCRRFNTAYRKNKIG